jgi:hypothetical protein
MFKNLMTATTALCLFACQETKTNTINIDVQQLEKEVLAIHDEVMPKMSEVISLTHYLDSVVKYKPGQDSLVMVSSLLKKADKDMMHWMRSYKSPEQPYDTASIQYLQKEKLKVVQLKLDINNALQLARPFKK